MTDLVPIVEALLFCCGDAPLKVSQIAEIVPEAGPEEIASVLEELRRRYDDGHHGVGLFRVAGGYQLLTRPSMGEWVEKFLVGRRRQRLSRPALETLAIVAYRQPVTRGEIEAIRGVDCGGVLHTLLDRRLVAVRGRAKRVGNPLLYATNDRFLEQFGIEELAELPKLEELRALCDREEVQTELRRQGVLPLSEAVANDATKEAAGEGREEARPEAFRDATEEASLGTTEEISEETTEAGPQELRGAPDAAGEPALPAAADTTAAVGSHTVSGHDGA